VSRVVEVWQGWSAVQQRLKALRAEREGVKTELVTLEGELEVLEHEEQGLAKHLETVRSQQRQQAEALRNELEMRLGNQLAQARQQMTEELQQDFTQQVAAFEARQRELIKQHFDQELRFEEAEIRQLGDEIETQTHHLLDRLAKLEEGTEIGKSLQTSTKRLVDQRKAKFEAHRQQLEAEQSQLIARRRDEFAAKLQQQREADLHSRLVVKEADLRQALAELLREAREQEARLVQAAEEQGRQAKQRLANVKNRHAALQAREQTLDQARASVMREVEALDHQRQISLAGLTETIQNSHQRFSRDTAIWFERVLEQLPPEQTMELGLVMRRALAQVERERQLEGQRRVLRERQLALHISREMEAGFAQEQQKRQQEETVKARQADEWLTKAKQLMARGQFDQALQFVAKAQALNPPQAATLAVIQDDIIVAKAQAHRRQTIEEVERLFANAMRAFEQGQYEDAIALFEQVVAKEANLNTRSAEELAVYAKP